MNKSRRKHFEEWCKKAAVWDESCGLSKDSVWEYIEELSEEIIKEARDYEEVLEDHNRLVRELDVLMNGDGVARQASLCDLVAQFPKWKREI